MVVQCENVETKCKNSIPGQCSHNSSPCGCQIECQAPNPSQPPQCTWNCDQTDPVCAGNPCLPPSPTPDCCYDNPSWCTTAKNCNATSDPFPAWLIVLILFFAFLLIFV